MKVLFTWHAAVEPGYRRFFSALSRQGVELTVVVPHKWIEGSKLCQYRYDAQDAGYRTVSSKALLVDHIKGFFYPNISLGN